MVVDLNRHPANLLAAKFLRQVKEPVSDPACLHLALWWLDSQPRASFPWPNEKERVQELAWSLVDKSPAKALSCLVTDPESLDADLKANPARSLAEVLVSYLDELENQLRKQENAEAAGAVLAENLHASLEARCFGR
jgi:hypothetical protein